jgi:rare lipoprotein A
MGAVAVCGCNYAPSGGQNAQKPQQNETGESESSHTQVGKASWYGPGLAGRETASGEQYDQTAMTAAHPSLPMGTKAEVTNLDNGKHVSVTINDRGPYAKGRAIDLSGSAANKLDMKKTGVAHVKIVTKRHNKHRHAKKQI